LAARLHSSEQPSKHVSGRFACERIKVPRLALASAASIQVNIREFINRNCPA